MNDHRRNENLRDAPSVQTHLSLLQANIARMAGASASCKTWCVTIIAALLAVSIDSGKGSVALVSAMPALIFCVLDAYYLSLERAYRRMYDRFTARIVAKDPSSEGLFQLRPDVTNESGVHKVLKALESVSVWPVYAATLGAALATAVVVGIP